MAHAASGEQKTLGDLETEDRIAQIHRREHSLQKSMREALHRSIREKITKERVASVQKVFAQMSAIIGAIFLVYIIFWWISGGYPIEGFFK
ncbi:MAG: hypothetical protein HYT11_02010 [Candidatus Levybacteria bacterium]|nr:hypothetical protein [Candidatus Levybacteria bacterium]